MTPKGLFIAAAIALTVAGCSRCGGSGTAAQDAGAQASAHDGADRDTPPEGTLLATDLRSALILIHPEFRFARISGEHTGVVREVTLPEGTSLLAALEAPLREKKFGNIREEEGAVLAESPPLRFEARRAKDSATTVTERLYLPIDDETFRKILHAPTPMGSEHLSALMPLPEGARFVRERFEMTLRYGARPDHASFLVRRLVEGLLQIGWEVRGTEVPKWEANLPDGGLDTVPHELELSLEQPQTGGRLHIDRRVGRVILEYVQPLARAR